MALPLYTHTVPPREHRSESNLLDCSCMVPAARTSMKVMCGRSGTGNPAVQKQGNSVMAHHDT